MKKILVTGTSGFVGNCIAQYMFRQGYQVWGTMNNRHIEAPFHLVKCDLTQKINIIKKFDVIVHIAGVVPYKENKFSKFKVNNIDIMDNVINFAIKMGIKRIIYFSTIGIYGEFRSEIIDENSDVINPGSYGITKYVAECLLRSEQNIESISLRMPGIIGKGSRGVWLADTVEKFKNGQDVKIYSPEFITKNFVWIDDLAKFIVQLIEMDEWKYDILTLACSEGASIRQIVTKIKDLTKSKSKIIIDDTLRKPFCLDNRRAVEMGYVSKNPIEIVRGYIKCAI
ncbi:NAD-dependent epimerase/dehydratase family protein [Pectinatus frisingensis]|uniref:NAD-dependent epimerase/dehydratase family protein n=1 Tax=Pectinatus frisingensis TaxID=865 RepID=UPI0018C7F089|nr:NAD(P)-dependent oxidoreductase [Pectinatus frisingensis]